ncbi:MAG: hypothetical protein JWN32_1926 [Solirubrobacterales bacterium]|nr:hypothetical protein [Solirubrobacterales bacterium]
MLNQATHCTIASSSCERLVQTRSAISSVLKDAMRREPFDGGGQGPAGEARSGKHPQADLDLLGVPHDDVEVEAPLTQEELVDRDGVGEVGRGHLSSQSRGNPAGGQQLEHR